MLWSAGSRSALPRKLFGPLLIIGAGASLVGCATTGSVRAPTQTVYAANAVAPSVVTSVQRPTRLEWHLRERMFEADVNFGIDELLPIQGAHVEAANDLPEQVARAAAQLAWKEHVDGIYVVRYQVAASSEDDFQTPPEHWNVHIVGREMALTQDSKEDVLLAHASGDPGIVVVDDADAIRVRRPKREPRPLSLVGVGVALDGLHDVSVDLSVGKKSIRSHVAGVFAWPEKSTEKVSIEAGAGYAFKFARSWVEVEPALLVGGSYSNYSKAWYNGLGERYDPVTVYAEPAVFARVYPVKMVSFDIRISANVPVVGLFRGVSLRSKLGVGFHF